MVISDRTKGCCSSDLNEPPRPTMTNLLNLTHTTGRTGAIASKNCAVVACQSSVQRSPPVRRRGSGACPDTRRSNKLCAITTSTYSVFPDSMSLPKLNPVEPPWYGPVCPVVGGRGGIARCPPIPILGQSCPFVDHERIGFSVPIPDLAALTRERGGSVESRCGAVAVG